MKQRSVLRITIHTYGAHAHHMTITRDMLNQHNQEKRAMSPDPFPRERAGSGNETRRSAVYCV